MASGSHFFDPPLLFIKIRRLILSQSPLLLPQVPPALDLISRLPLGPHPASFIPSFSMTLFLLLCPILPSSRYVCSHTHLHTRTPHALHTRTSHTRTTLITHTLTHTHETYIEHTHTRYTHNTLYTCTMCKSYTYPYIIHAYTHTLYTHTQHIYITHMHYAHTIHTHIHHTHIYTHTVYTHTQHIYVAHTCIMHTQ